MNENFCRLRNLLGGFVALDKVFACFDYEFARPWQSVHAVGSSQNPALIDDGTTAQVTVGNKGRIAPLKTDLMGKFTLEGILTAYNAIELEEIRKRFGLSKKWMVYKNKFYFIIFIVCCSELN